jgi:hypothetical protein
MKQPVLSLGFFIFLITCGTMTLLAQYHCAEAAAKKIPWQISPETKSGQQAQYMKPMFAEMQRLFPQPPPGLEVTYGIYDAQGRNYQRFSTGTDYYEGYLMIKDIVCERQSNNERKILPEGETGCWFYVRCNDFQNLMTNFLGGTVMYLNNTELPLFTGDIRLEENENGMMSVYVFNQDEEQTFAGWFFSARKALPIRKISKKELALAFYNSKRKELEEKNQSLQKTLTASKEAYKRVQANNSYKSPGEKEKVLQSFIDGDKKIVDIMERNRIELNNCRQRTDAMMGAANADEPAAESNISELMYGQERPAEKAGNGRFVYVEDETYFSKALPKAQPQFIVASLRRQDKTPAKTAFIKKTEDEFDWNVVRKMVGAAPTPQPLTISAMGDSPGGYTSGALPAGTTPTASNGNYYSEDFAASATGKPPVKWTVSNSSAIVKEINGSRQLAMKNPGLFFPDYAVLQLPQNFTLSFDLSWNPGISYYSPEFLFHIGAAEYDNTLKRYNRQQVNLNSYTSAKMHRICLWMDPHWNSSGKSGMQVFDERGGFLFNKSNKATQFFKNKNQVAVKMIRQGARLTVYFNGEQVWDLSDAMQPNIHWNFFGCGLENAPNADPADEFYFTNLQLKEK